ncbi:MAG: XRE family transcriptional regulator [Candidatus Thermoplasmatota archaeon]|nr:XRE family transcriptional regulator [Candidatus Thermoplasmatota archaeon]
MSRKPSLNVEVEPTVLQWAVETSGWAHAEIAKKLKISPTTFQNWFTGNVQPTVKQLEVLSTTLKRPLATFFLSNPPKEQPLPKDYRMLPEKEGKFDKKTILAIRRARRLQNISKDLAENLNVPLRTVISYVKQSDDPKKIAECYRKELNFSSELQTKLKTPYEVFTFLRDALEEKNIIVFQIPMLLEDARGFALVDNSPEVLVANSKDQIEARIFILMHEFGHVLLHESGVSMPERTLFAKRVGPVEKWCNDFAAGFLLTRSIAESEFPKYKQTLTETSTLNKLSRQYKVSKAMLLYNMFKLQYISKKEYDAVQKRYKFDKVKGPSTGFGVSADKRCIREKGQKFVSLVVNNFEQGLITRSDALDYLSIKSKNLEKILSRVKK